MKSVDSLKKKKKKKETTRGKSAQRSVHYSGAAGTQDGSSGLASVCTHSGGPALPLPIPPHPQSLLLTALLSSKTPESLINYKHAFSSVCRRQISVLAAVSIPLVPLIDLAV